MLEHSPAHILLILLHGEGLLTLASENKDWRGYYAKMPSLIDTSPGMISLMDEGGSKDGRISKTGENIWKPIVQIRVRHPEYSKGWHKMYSILEYLSSVHNKTLSMPNSDVQYIIRNASQISSVLNAGTTKEEKTHKNLTTSILLTINKENV